MGFAVNVFKNEHNICLFIVVDGRVRRRRRQISTGSYGSSGYPYSGSIYGGGSYYSGQYPGGSSYGYGSGSMYNPYQSQYGSQYPYGSSSKSG